ncbi:hypothetical protein [Actinoallomurus soli]|uniref:hypothetical protein n=1 Tax=Actinoallomurus soli TaxID=2952535 RepID=UPI002092AC55|nr:hypothetical protein [Actinoallomurus soli]MCO5971310.1 hypothetical protein [Actinoallomurus soli]
MAALAAGPVLIAVGVALGAGPFADFEAYERAPLCGSPPPADTGHCVTRLPMTVIKKSTYTTEDPDPPDPPQFPQPPPPPPPPMGPFRVVLPTAVRQRVVAASRTTHYKVTVRTADGRYHDFEVEHGFYKVAETGTTGTADIWHGRVVRLQIGTHVDDEWPDWKLGIPVCIVLAGTVVFVVVVIRLIRRRVRERRRRRRGSGFQGSPWGAW